MEKIYQQSAVIPFRYKKDKLQILLITSLRSGKWIIPKGMVEPDLNAQQSAMQEAFEEAGVEGKIFPDVLGKYSYKKWGGLCKVKIFSMEVENILNEWPEKNLRRRKWFSAEKAAHQIKKRALKNILHHYITHKTA